MSTRFCELVGVEYPVIQGAMARISDGRLAGAVSEAGGIGIIAGMNVPTDILREQIRIAKSITKKPFGVNVMLMADNAEEVAKLVIEEGVKVVTTGAGSPGKFIQAWKEAGVVVIPVVPSVAIAKMMVRAGADAVVAEGTESGGHVGELTTMALVPQVVDAVGDKVPVLAAGGIADGRGICAAYMLGADGVQMGTRFLSAKECNIHPNYKAKILAAKDIDTVVTGKHTGHPVRVIKNKLARTMIELEKRGAAPEEYEQFGVGALRKAVEEGDMDYGSVMSGQIAGLVNKEQTCKEIIEEIFTEAKEVYESRKALI
ncbi:MAG: enoyl-[acyl-carrier-protein] reductase FabK [Lachnospiraceae bacterium]|nr:enoyl-[acyl-carrier-protein] reductase FabK [Lachnospiraceae bacterium]